MPQLFGQRLTHSRIINDPRFRDMDGSNSGNVRFQLATLQEEKAQTEQIRDR